MTACRQKLLKPAVAALALGVSAIANGEVTLPRLVSDGMVLQRQAAVKIWGRADAGEKVRVIFNSDTHHTETGDNGYWSVTLKDLPTGGPYRMVIEGENRIELENILVGDVWLASGQSNMEYPIKRIAHRFADEIDAVNNPLIRQFRVPQTYDFNRARTDLEAGTWQPATRENIQDFTAVGYFFAAETQQREQVPIGLINSSLGGSPAEAWVSEETLQQFPHHLQEKKKFESQALIEQIQKKDRARSDQWYATAAEKDRGLAEGETPWYSPALNTGVLDTGTRDTGHWQDFTVPGYWADQTDNTDNGIFWFRKNIHLPAALAGKPGLLELGRIVDADETYINGEKVGNTTYLYPRRRYAVPRGLLKAGENTIAIRVTNSSGRGGFVKDKPYRLTVGGQQFDLRGNWQFQQAASMPPLPGQTFVRWKPGGLYNAMVHPLQHYRIKGALWYQGESNVGRAEEYRKLFPALIRDWRAGWADAAGQTSLPFLFVQLANFLEPTSEPTDSAWAELRAAQASALKLPETAMATIIDSGEWNDIHPLDKKVVGHRLALAAASEVYGHEKIVSSGPVLHKADFQQDAVRLHFVHRGAGLVARGGPLQHFAIAGDDGVFHWAQAEIHKNTVVVHSQAVSNPQAVRYAWADNPDTANLYNRNGLPAAPFQITRTTNANER